jgi:lipoprotein-anchoring transpeptidase ErfK/SrfK
MPHAGWAAKPPILLRIVLAAGLIALACARADTAGAASPVARTQALVTLLASQTVRAAPRSTASAVMSIDGRRPITTVRTVLPVLGRAAGGWLRVRLPGRPNSRTGWISVHATSLSVTPWHLVVDRARRRVVAFRSGHAVKAFSAVVGKPSTPTPRGEFFVEEAVRLSSGDVGAPFALALSARSTVLQEFDGGPGQVALHGLENVGGTLGTAASHGCVRLDTAAMNWLVGRIGAGTPVTIID